MDGLVQIWDNEKPFWVYLFISIVPLLCLRYQKGALQMNSIIFFTDKFEQALTDPETDFVYPCSSKM